jgi:serine/threonine protein kinase
MNSQLLESAPTLHEGCFSENFTGRPLPIQTISKIGEGSGGRIYTIRIHTNHHNFRSIKGSECEFALKISKHSGDAARELAFLTLLSTHATQHPHITTFYTGFQFSKQTYLISELATSDLPTYLSTSPTGLTRPWFLSQCLGLASALATIHKLNAYHHDIKPANILVFLSTSTIISSPPPYPTFKLTDFGCTGFKALAGTPTHGDTPTLSPETEKRGLSAQPHDVWSLGCVVLQLLIWWRGGWEKLRDWKDRQLVESLNYYEVREDGVKVRTRLVEGTLTGLEQVESDSLVVDMVREMLEIDPEKRLMAEEVVRRLSEVM